MDNTSKQVTSSIATASFEAFNVPLLAEYCPIRPDDEIRFRNVIIGICNEPGIVVVTGDKGIGKTTLVSRVFDDEPRNADRDAFVTLRQPTVVFWLNCYKWRNAGFSYEDRLTFNTELVNIVKLCDSEFDKSTTAIVPYFRDVYKKRVLFVLDDVLNVDLLDFFISSQSANSSSLSCCIVTHSSAIWPRFADFRLVVVEPMSNESIFKMLHLFYGMKDTFPIATLSACCLGLPVIASLIAAQPISIQSFFEQSSVWLCENSSKSSIVTSLFKLSVNGMTSQNDRNLRYFYYAFLFFEPGVPISLLDLSVFWGEHAVTAAVAKIFTDSNLANKVRISETPGDEFLVVHQLMYEAALEIAAQEFHLQGSAFDQLRVIRRKLIFGELKDDTEHSEMLIFDAVRHQRLQLCQRFVEVIDVEALSQFCLARSSDDESRIFLHFLFCATWPGQVIATSCHLVTQILLKLKNDGEENKLTATFRNLKQSNWKLFEAFLTDIFDDCIGYPYSERRPVVEVLNPWWNYYMEAKWRSKMLERQSEIPMLSAILTGDDESGFKNAYKQWNEGDQLPKDLRRLVDDLQENIDPKDVDSDDDLLNDDDILKLVSIAAARCGQVGMLEFLYEQQNEITAQWAQQQMNYACSNGHLKVVTLLVEKQGTLTVQSDDRGIYCEIYPPDDQRISTPTMKACLNGHLDVVKYLAQKSKNQVLEADGCGRTPMHCACENGHLEVVKFLVETDAGQLEAVSSRRTPFVVACEKGHLEIVKFLLQKDETLLSVVDHLGLTPMHWACEKGHLGVVKLLTEKNRKLVSQSDSIGLTPLSFACRHGNLNVVIFLVENDPNLVTMPDKRGSTPLHWACKYGHLNVAKFLTEKEPKLLTVADNMGRTVLHWASECGFLDIVQFLADNGGNLALPAIICGRTPMILACENGHLDVVKFLAKRDSQLLSQTDNRGQTPMMAACRKGYFDIVQFLTEQEQKSLTDTWNCISPPQSAAYYEDVFLPNHSELLL